MVRLRAAGWVGKEVSSRQARSNRDIILNEIIVMHITKVLGTNAQFFPPSSSADLLLPSLPHSLIRQPDGLTSPKASPCSYDAGQQRVSTVNEPGVPITEHTLDREVEKLELGKSNF